MDVGAVVLAAGEGKRFGGNKLLSPFDGEPILKRVLLSLEGVDRVLVIGRYAEEILKELKNEVMIYNPKWQEGMSTSIKLGVRFMKDHEYVLIALGDMPLVTREDVKKILSMEVKDAVIPTHGGKKGNPVLFRTSSLMKFLDRISGDEGMRNVLREMETSTVECGIGVVKDVDTRDDLSLS
ncbi:Bifunctional protein GlmU [Sulfuracidifex tepidarius]|uniref:Bifunctional protein GlmU n=2 Tax=Sulfuracidifex tepidarius TaxID=1294262 RepID=A0A510DYG5_9CREN|nr:Bifunctional protein GlmU [Sulfuracidifex tepidarius]BBG28066.1 Bifunctional protein GlmU [Sulfuracidifex tepidarius]